MRAQTVLERVHAAAIVSLAGKLKRAEAQAREQAIAAEALIQDLSDQLARARFDYDAAARRANVLK
jgi:hypothetical protein